VGSWHDTRDKRKRSHEAGFFFSSRRRHTRSTRDWSSDVCSSDLENADRHFALVRAAYEKATGNRWSQSDSEAYNENGIHKLPAAKIVSAMEAVAGRTSAKIRSFNYFVKEIVSLQEPRNRAWQKKRLEKIVRRIRDSSVGRTDYSQIDFVEDVKCAC